MSQIVDLPPPGRGTRLSYRGWQVFYGWVDLGVGPELILAHEITPGQGVLVRRVLSFGDTGQFLNAAKGHPGSVIVNQMPFVQGLLKDHFTVDLHPAVIQNDFQFKHADGTDYVSDECCDVMNTINFEWQKLSDLPTQAWPQLTAKSPNDPP